MDLNQAVYSLDYKYKQEKDPLGLGQLIEPIKSSPRKSVWFSMENKKGEIISSYNYKLLLSLKFTAKDILTMTLRSDRNKVIREQNEHISFSFLFSISQKI